MTDDFVARASVHVKTSPERAFALFTGDIASWWRRGTDYWNDSARGIRYEFEPRVGGRFLEVYDDGAFEVGTVTTWDAGRLLEFGWRQGNWAPGSTSTVRVRFTADGDGTLIELEHSGWQNVQMDDGVHQGYERGWAEILGWFEQIA